jgi:hypothetical protein
MLSSGPQLIFLPGQVPCVDAITSGGRIGGCKPLDIACICENGSLLDSIACCLEEKCDAAGKEAAVKYASQICGSDGVKDIPTEVVCKTTASETGTKTSEAVNSASTAAEQSADSTTGTGTGTAAAQSTSATETDAAAGVSAPVGLMGAMLFGWLAL